MLSAVGSVSDGAAEQLEVAVPLNLKSVGKKIAVKDASLLSTRHQQAFVPTQRHLEPKSGGSHLEILEGSRHSVNVTSEHAVIEVTEDDVQAAVAMSFLELAKDRLYGKSEKQRAQRVPLLNSRLGGEGWELSETKARGFCVTPLGPRR